MSLFLFILAACGPEPKPPLWRCAAGEYPDRSTPEGRAECASLCTEENAVLYICPPGDTGPLDPCDRSCVRYVCYDANDVWRAQ